MGLKCQNSECGGYNTTRTQKRASKNETPASTSNDTKDDNNDGACSSNSRNVA